jgi:hypothetical protein
MSTIPYNYGKYIDDKVSMSNSGTVDAGRQVQSPASAGSRGLAKTTQFTKDPTQMKMGNSPIAESMVEIRNILNRIDGVNVPTNEMNELADDDKIEFTKVMLDISQIKDRVEALSVDEDAKKSAIQSLTNAEEALVALDETAVQEKQSPYTTDKEGAGWIMANKDKIITQLYAGGIQSVLDPKDAVKAISDLIPDVTEKQIIDIIKKDDAFAGETAVREDIGDKGRIALEKAGFDPMKVKEYMAVFNDHGDTSDIDQMNMDKVGLADAMSMVLASHDIENESYEPFPEEDEMTFEDDDAFYEAFGELGFPEDETELFDAEYRGRKVPLNKPMAGDVKKFKVYVKDPKSGNVKKVNFGHGGTSAKRAGQKTMRIRKSNPKARKSFRARHNCANPGPKTKARYWSCRKW